MITLNPRWAEFLVSQPETGMGYQVATVTTHDGRIFEGVVIVGDKVTNIHGDREIPFTDEDIATIVVQR
jgi:hypothetical protein